MKSTIKNLVLATAALLFACSFAEIPAPGAAAGVEAAPVGGAYLVFAGKFGGEVTKNDLQGQTSLGVDGCAKGSRIFQYTLTVTKDGKTSSYEGRSQNLTKEMTSALAGLSNGDSFEFKTIKAYLPNGKDVVDVHAKRFTVVAKKA